ncbi:MAG: TIM44-like domain-containing protein, partial [Deltaproteobacteria bacterium]|nr:TIM44-like domain-containing protein [Deltaproteobacteria bacterium]
GIGGGGGGGGGDLGDIAALVYLLVAYPQVGVPVVIIVIVAAIVQRARNPERTTRRAVGRLEEMDRPDTSALAGIKERDPGFDEGAFLARFGRLETAVQEAWARGDMARTRPLLSDGLTRRFETQLAIMRRQGVRDALADHRILESRIHAVETDSHFDTIHVAVRAEARDTEVAASFSFDEATATARKAPLRPYAEIWSVLRRPGVKTLQSEGAFGAQCPNCGGALPASQSTRCEHCKALVNSGDYDWVAAEITQPEEWRPGSTGQVPGLDELSARDPGFNRQAAEDRASYLFWRWIEALVGADAKPLAKCATPELRARIAEQVKAGPAALHKVAVGAVDLMAVAAGEEGGRDLVYAKILWSSARSNKDAAFPSAHVLVLGRRAGAKDDGGLSHARCPSCHGPLTENDSPKCDYCGENLSAGDADFVLDDVKRPEEIRVARSAGDAADGAEEMASRWIPDMGSRRERNLLLMRMAAVVVADGQITRAERKLLSACAKRWSVPLEVVEPILTGAVPADVSDTMKPSNPSGFLAGLVAAALVDGRIDSREDKLLRGVGKDLGLDDAAVQVMIDSMKARAKALQSVRVGR